MIEIIFSNKKTVFFMSHISESLLQVSSSVARILSVTGFMWKDLYFNHYSTKKLVTDLYLKFFSKYSSKIYSY